MSLLGNVLTCLVLAQETDEDCGIAVQKHMALQNTTKHDYQISVVLLTAGSEAELVYKWDSNNCSTLKERKKRTTTLQCSELLLVQMIEKAGKKPPIKMPWVVGLMSQPTKKVDVTGLPTSGTLNQINEFISIVTQPPFLNRSKIIVKKKQGSTGLQNLKGKKKKTPTSALALTQLCQSDNEKGLK